LGGDQRLGVGRWIGTWRCARIGTSFGVAASAGDLIAGDYRMDVRGCTLTILP
jgi:hypothetical protein